MLLTYLFVKTFHSQGFRYCIGINFNIVIYMPFVDYSVIVDMLITVQLLSSQHSTLQYFCSMFVLLN